MILGYTTSNLYNKNTKYQKIYQEQESDIMDLTNYILDVKEKIDSTYNTLLEVDMKGSFQSDDEVGVVFDEIKKITEELNEMFKQIEVKDDNK